MLTCIILCGIRVIFLGISLNGGKTWQKGRIFCCKPLHVFFYTPDGVQRLLALSSRPRGCGDSLAQSSLVRAVLLPSEWKGWQNKGPRCQNAISRELLSSPLKHLEHKDSTAANKRADLRAVRPHLKFPRSRSDFSAHPVPGCSYQSRVAHSNSMEYVQLGIFSHFLHLPRRHFSMTPLLISCVITMR